MDYSLLVVYTRATGAEDEEKDEELPRRAMVSRQSMWNVQMQEDSKVYYGIIDVLCPYNFKKRLARTFKVATGQPATGLSTVPADMYGARFIEFLENHVLL